MKTIKNIASILIFISTILFSTQVDFTNGTGVFIKKDELSISYIEPKSIKKVRDNYVVDFGKSAFGKLVMNSNLTDTLIIHFGEKLNQTGLVDKNPRGSIRYQKSQYLGRTNQNVTIKLGREKINSSWDAIKLPDTIGVIMPFRYCEIEGVKNWSNFNISLKQKVYNFKFNDSASVFESSDTILNKIWDLGKHTVKATSFTGVYIDGDRERLPYEADAYINMLSHFCLDNEYEIAKRTNEYFLKNPSWPTEWVLLSIPLFYNYTLYSGDTTTLRKYYKNLKFRSLSAFKRPDGLISSSSSNVTYEDYCNIGFKRKKIRFNYFLSDAKLKVKELMFRKKTPFIRDIIDWPNKKIDKTTNVDGESDNYDMVPYNIVVNSYYFYSLKLLSKIAVLLNENEDANYYIEEAKRVMKQINNVFFDSKKGLYLDGEETNHTSLHGNMFPLAFGIVEEKNKAVILRYIKSKGMACSVYGSQFLLKGLIENGEELYALKLLTSKGKRSWWNMIREGSTMTTEAWDVDFKDNMDWSHSWGTAPVNIITRYLWGIKPVSLGGTKILVFPKLEGLSFSNIKVPINNHELKAKYRREGTSLIYEILVPKNCEIHFKINKNNRLKSINNEKINFGDRKELVLEEGCFQLIIES